MSFRSGKRWNINEVLRLQREYELLEMNVYQIAKKHQRSVIAVVCRLETEGFITDSASARGYSVSDVVASEIAKQMQSRVCTRSRSLRSARPLCNAR
jgi:hypothetical protein